MTPFSIYFTNNGTKSIIPDWALITLLILSIAVLIGIVCAICMFYKRYNRKSNPWEEFYEADIYSQDKKKRK